MTPARPRALITGASRGIGAAIARALADTHELLLGGRDQNTLQEQARQLPHARPWVCDLSQPDTLSDAAGGIDRLDVLIHNAAIPGAGALADTPLQDWQHAMAVNLLAPVELTRVMLPLLRAARGHVIVINARSAAQAIPGRGAYVVGKRGLAAWADILRAEEPRLQVTSVYPGPTDTDLQRRAAPGDGRAYHPSDYLDPDHIARTVVHALRTPGATLTDITITHHAGRQAPWPS